MDQELNQKVISINKEKAIIKKVHFEDINLEIILNETNTSNNLIINDNNSQLMSATAEDKNNNNNKLGYIDDFYDIIEEDNKREENVTAYAHVDTGTNNNEHKKIENIWNKRKFELENISELNAKNIAKNWKKKKYSLEQVRYINIYYLLK
jgi:hypothetical protein